MFSSLESSILIIDLIQKFKILDERSRVNFIQECEDAFAPFDEESDICSEQIISILYHYVNHSFSTLEQDLTNIGEEVGFNTLNTFLRNMIQIYDDLFL